MVTRDRINSFFCEITALGDGNVFSERGFKALADWSERQPWWCLFVLEYSLRADWRSAGTAESYLFTVNLFKFLNGPSRSLVVLGGAGGTVSNEIRAGLRSSP
ncbi:hypothetical protein [Geomonas azotofigens]|uniref:hypothetical protein n=1 Tax=Geomonas azotofigens TaxID=2843196 RepID=UPI001C1181F8|nr:hypothetical protein [Geomonas azotofigens]MBU5613900.1 hypothetical protein [Geomonas azotofigens]